MDDSLLFQQSQIRELYHTDGVFFSFLRFKYNFKGVCIEAHWKLCLVLFVKLMTTTSTMHCVVHPLVLRIQSSLFIVRIDRFSGLSVAKSGHLFFYNVVSLVCILSLTDILMQNDNLFRLFSVSFAFNLSYFSRLVIHSFPLRWRWNWELLVVVTGSRIPFFCSASVILITWMGSTKMALQIHTNTR